MTPAWARDFNNQPRHCWVNVHGGRFLDWRVAGYVPGEMTECHTDHDPRLVGNTEWLRFIHAFGAAAIDNPFAPNDQPGPNDPRYYLFNEVDGHSTSDGRHAYCETYLLQQPQSWGADPVFRVFLANEAGWARIECYDEKMVGACEQALGEVERSYGQEVTR